MGKRKRIGLVFSLDKNWIGGSYYILNLISALGTLPEDKQPVIVILSKNQNDFRAARQTKYRFLKYRNPFDFKRSLFEAAVNTAFKMFFRKDLIDKRISAKHIDVLFPANNYACFDKVKNKVYWFPDFQHIFYPEFFSKNEMDLRNAIIEEVSTHLQNLILSSNAAKNDYKTSFASVTNKLHVVPFAVTHPELHHIRISDLLKEYQIDSEYFMISNQFWKHKNHMVVFQAIKKLSKQGVKYQFVFTGQENDNRDPGYFQILKDFIVDNQLAGFVKMLGLIDRHKQLKLMQFSKAVIQPSLFEGWSTVVEDAKALGKMVIASNIPVHKEQLVSGAFFFNPSSSDELVEKIEQSIVQPSINSSLDYKKNVIEFGETFMSVIENL